MSKFVITRQEKMMSYNIYIDIYFSLKVEDTHYTNDINLALHFDTAQEAAKLKELLNLYSFDIREIPELSRSKNDTWINNDRALV